MANKIRRYELKRLDNANVKRSLQGAAKRSEDDVVFLGFCTKMFVFPDEFDQSKLPDGGVYIEGYTNGIFTDDYLNIVFFGWYPGNLGKRESFEQQFGIKLCEIDGDIGVRYKEYGQEKRCDGCQEKTCNGCPGKEELEATNA